MRASRRPIKRDQNVAGTAVKPTAIDKESLVVLAGLG
jgi:hypothetical protein